MSEMMINGVSILVVTRGRVKLLRELFCSLDVARENCSLPTELIVFDNSDPDDAEFIKGLTEGHGGRYFFSQSSVAVKRNLCAAEAGYDLLFFCDSDCLVTENILNEHIRAYRSDGIGATCGPVILQGKTNRFVELMSRTAWCDAFVQPLKQDELLWGATANFTVLKKVFTESGGFNERFPNKPGGEDVDIGFKVCDRGYKIKSVPEAVVYHSNQTWLRVGDVVSRLFSYGKSNVLVAIEHKDRLIADVNWLGIWFVILLCATTLSFVTSPAILVAPLIFPVLQILLSVAATCIAEKQNPLDALTVELLSVVEKWGSIVGCFKYGTLIPMYRQVLYSKYQEHGSYPANQIKYVVLLISTLISCAASTLII